jgi:hypothetical protein
VTTIAAKGEEVQVPSFCRYTDEPCLSILNPTDGEERERERADSATQHSAQSKQGRSASGRR